jgi:flavodoxin
VFFIYTCGSHRGGYTKAIAKVAAEKGATILGEYGCLGYDTFGPFKLIGGIAKDHPDEAELDGARRFYQQITEETT